MSDVRFERPMRRYLAWATQAAVAVFAGVWGLAGSVLTPADLAAVAARLGIPA
jgi:hypothetical protein